MNKISQGKVAEIEYTMWLSNGEIADDTEGKPMPYLHGAGEIIPGLEAALEGRAAGDSFRLELSPSDAYGEIDDSLTDELPRDYFPEDVEVALGDEITVETEDGDEMVGYVTEVEGDTISVDFNHPFAGEPIKIEVKVVAVREATAEELAQGYVDDPHADERHSCGEGCGHDHGTDEGGSEQLH